MLCEGVCSIQSFQPKPDKQPGPSYVYITLKGKVSRDGLSKKRTLQPSIKTFFLENNSFCVGSPCTSVTSVTSVTQKMKIKLLSPTYLCAVLELVTSREQIPAGLTMMRTMENGDDANSILFVFGIPPNPAPTHQDVDQPRVEGSHLQCSEVIVWEEAKQQSSRKTSRLIMLIAVQLEKQAHASCLEIIKDLAKCLRQRHFTKATPQRSRVIPVCEASVAPILPDRHPRAVRQIQRCKYEQWRSQTSLSTAQCSKPKH